MPPDFPMSFVIGHLSLVICPLSFVYSYNRTSDKGQVTMDNPPYPPIDWGGQVTSDKGQGTNDKSLFHSYGFGEVAGLVHI